MNHTVSDREELAANTPVAVGGSTTFQYRVEVLLAVVALAVLCVLVLRVAPPLVEPDDYAYRASIVAMTKGHFLTFGAAVRERRCRRPDRSGGRPCRLRGVSGR